MALWVRWPEAHSDRSLISAFVAGAHELANCWIAKTPIRLVVLSGNLVDVPDYSLKCQRISVRTWRGVLVKLRISICLVHIHSLTTLCMAGYGLAV